jgi:hypothetical protein
MTSTTEPPASDPVRPVFVNWADGSTRLESLVHLIHEGFGQLLKVPQVLELLEADEGRKDRAQRIAAQANDELDAGFPIVHSSILLALWSLLETFVDDLVVAALANDLSLVQREQFGRLRVPPTYFLRGPDECARSIVAEWRREDRTTARSGVGRFERQLDLVGLAGPVPQQIAHAIHQSHHVRNVWAHRSGYADSHFLERCGDFGVSLGERVDLPIATFARLMHGCHMYVLLVHCRYLARIGRDVRIGHCVGYEGVLDSLDFTVGG